MSDVVVRNTVSVALGNRRHGEQRVDRATKSRRDGHPAVAPRGRVLMQVLGHAREDVLVVARPALVG